MLGFTEHRALLLSNCYHGTIPQSWGLDYLASNPCYTYCFSDAFVYFAEHDISPPFYLWLTFFSVHVNTFIIFNYLHVQVANFEEILEDNDENTTGGGGDEIHELTQRNAIIVSPYRANPNYRRPATDSDHGYSTMTPMGDLDSEIVPYVDSTSARNRLQRLQQRSNNVPSSIQSMTSGEFDYFSSTWITF